MDFHRINKSWDDLKLADSAGLSAKTVERARKGLPIKTDSLFRIAKALEIEPAELIDNLEAAIRPSESAANKPRMLVVFVVEDDSALEEYIANGGVNKLMFTLAYRGLLKDGILNEQVFDGSKIILVDISQDDYNRMSQMLSVMELKNRHDVVYFGAITDKQPLETQLAEIKKTIAEAKDKQNKAFDEMDAMLEKHAPANDKKPKRKAT